MSDVCARQQQLLWTGLHEETCMTGVKNEQREAAVQAEPGVIEADARHKGSQQHDGHDAF